MIGKYLLKQLNDLRRLDTFCDLELISGDGNSFKVHHIVFLALNPRYYEKYIMEKQYQKPMMNKNMLLSCVNYEELKAVVDFIYGKPVVLRSRFDVLKKALEKLSMDHLIKEAGGFTFMPEMTEVKTEEEPAEVKTEPEDTSCQTHTHETEENTSTSSNPESKPTDVSLESNNASAQCQIQTPPVETTTSLNSLENTHTQSAGKERAFTDAFLNIEKQTLVTEPNVTCEINKTTAQLEGQSSKMISMYKKDLAEKCHSSSAGNLDKIGAHQDINEKNANKFNKQKYITSPKLSVRKLLKAFVQRKEHSGNEEGNLKNMGKDNFSQKPTNEDNSLDSYIASEREIQCENAKENPKDNFSQKSADRVDKVDSTKAVSRQTHTTYIVKNSRGLKRGNMRSQSAVTGNEMDSVMARQRQAGCVEENSRDLKKKKCVEMEKNSKDLQTEVIGQKSSEKSSEIIPNSLIELEREKQFSNVGNHSKDVEINYNYLQVKHTEEIIDNRTNDGNRQNVEESVKQRQIKVIMPGSYKVKTLARLTARLSSETVKPRIISSDKLNLTGSGSHKKSSSQEMTAAEKEKIQKYILNTLGNYRPIQPKTANIQTMISSTSQATIENKSDGTNISLVNGTLSQGQTYSFRDGNHTYSKLQEKYINDKMRQQNRNADTDTIMEKQVSNTLKKDPGTTESDIQNSGKTEITTTLKSKDIEKADTKHIQSSCSSTRQQLGKTSLNKEIKRILTSSRADCQKYDNIEKDNPSQKGPIETVEVNKDTNKDSKGKANDAIIMNSNKGQNSNQNEQINIDTNDNISNKSNDYTHLNVISILNDEPIYQVNMDTNRDSKDEVRLNSNNDFEDKQKDRSSVITNMGLQDKPNYHLCMDTNYGQSDKPNHQATLNSNKEIKDDSTDQVNVDEIDPQDKSNDQIDMNTNSELADKQNDQINLNMNKNFQDKPNDFVNIDTHNDSKSKLNNQVNMYTNNDLNGGSDDLVTMNTNSLYKDKPNDQSVFNSNNTLDQEQIVDDCRCDEINGKGELIEQKDVKSKEMQLSDFSKKGKETVCDKLEYTRSNECHLRNARKRKFLFKQRNSMQRKSKSEDELSINSKSNNILSENLLDIDSSEGSVNTDNNKDSETMSKEDSHKNDDEMKSNSIKCHTENELEIECVNILNNDISESTSDKEVVSSNVLDEIQVVHVLSENNDPIRCVINVSQSADKNNTESSYDVQVTSQNCEEKQTALQSGQSSGKHSTKSTSAFQKTDGNVNTNHIVVHDDVQERTKESNETLDAANNGFANIDTRELNVAIGVKSTELGSQNSKLSNLLKNCLPQPNHMVRLSLGSSSGILPPDDSTKRESINIGQMNCDNSPKANEHSYSKPDHNQSLTGKYQEIATCLSGKGFKSCSGENSHPQKSSKDSGYGISERCDDIVQCTASAKCNVPDTEILKLSASNFKGKSRMKHTNETVKIRKKVKVTTDMLGKVIECTDKSSSVELSGSNLSVDTLLRKEPPCNVRKKRSLIRRKLRPSGNELKRILDKRTVSVKLCRLSSTELMGKKHLRFTKNLNKQPANTVQTRKVVEIDHFDVGIGPGSIWKDNPLGKQSSDTKKGTQEVLQEEDYDRQVSAKSNDLEAKNNMRRQTDEEFLQQCYEKQRNEMLDFSHSPRKLAPKSSTAVETGPKIPVICYKVTDSKVALCPIRSCQKSFTPIFPKQSNSNEHVNENETLVSDSKGESEPLFDSNKNTFGIKKDQQTKEEILRNVDESCPKDGHVSSEGTSKTGTKKTEDEDIPLSVLAKNLGKRKRTKIRKPKTKIEEDNTPLSMLAKNLKLRSKTKNGNSKLNDKKKQCKGPKDVTEPVGDNAFKMNNKSTPVLRKQILEKEKCPNTQISTVKGAQTQQSETRLQIFNNKRKLNDNDTSKRNIDDNKKLKVCESTNEDNNTNVIPTPKYLSSDSIHGTLSKGSTGSYRLIGRPTLSSEFHRKSNTVKKKSPVSSETVCHPDNLLYEFDSREVLKKKLSFN